MTRYKELKTKIESQYLDAKSVNDMRFYLLCLMALETGARVSDLLKLEFNSIDGNMINYLNYKSKIKQNQRITDSLKSHIERYKETITVLGQYDRTIFYNPQKGKPMARMTANRRSQKEDNMNFHQFRKESGKNTASQKGVVIASKFLGHSKVSITDIYLGVSDEEYKKQMMEVDI